MTDTTITWQRPATPQPFFTRRVHALFRLMRLRHRRWVGTRDLRFADDRMLVDAGLRRARRGDNWARICLGR